MRRSTTASTSCMKRRTGGESWAIEQATAAPIPLPQGQGLANTRLAPAQPTPPRTATLSKSPRIARWQKVASFLVNIASLQRIMKTDPIELELFRHLLVSIAEEMGAVLRKTSFSANIKERRDYSCAVYDAAGETVAMGDHMPVHLGAMPLSVQHATQAFDLAPGDVAILNDPFRGGTHLPDITAVSGVFLNGQPQAGVLRRESRASRRRRRHEPRLDAAGARDLPGGHSHSAGAAGARRPHGSRAAGR